MTAPDSPAVAEVREMAADYRRFGRLGHRADALDGVLAELDEARRQPRVRLEGDEVPAGVHVLDETGEVFTVRHGFVIRLDRIGPLVELAPPPDYAAAVAAERERRALDRAESPQTPSRQVRTDSGAIAPQRRSEGQHGASSVEPEATR